MTQVWDNKASLLLIISSQFTLRKHEETFICLLLGLGKKT
jgi:hypothetical protein